MNAATAAAMSDPDRNPMFRRRWVETAAAPVTPRSTAGAFGPIGLALIDAWRRKQQANSAASVLPGSATPR
jgi:hypothetical protein